ncbi:MAG: inosine/xanthosine triphosphatase [Lewinella sp.]|nr:inosine/xanthosine triphosphatase [Lewinella sp.]
MIQVVVASTNPTKMTAVSHGFQEMFPGEVIDVSGVSVPSGVPDQPIGDEETYRGAYNRLQAARAAQPGANYWVGIEGGNVETPHGMEVMAWVVIQSPEREGKARTAGFYLPPRVIELVHQGYELGHADDIVFGTHNSKQEMGSSGLLTHNVMTRVRFYRQAVILALIPFVQPDLYPPEQ